MRCHDPVYVCNLLRVEAARHPRQDYEFPELVTRASRAVGEVPAEL
jgi:hypothetical protein